MILSKTMHPDDYEKLHGVLSFMEALKKSGVDWLKVQHRHRAWEYAMALESVGTWLLFRTNPVVIADIGCAASFLSPALVSLGHRVLMYEVWQFNAIDGIPLKEFTVKSVEKAKTLSRGGSYELKEVGLGQITDKVDVALCVSTLEHIQTYEQAYQNLLDMVNPGGMFFLTTDFAEDEEDHYLLNQIRAGRMFTAKTYRQLIGIAQNNGFQVMGETDYSWSEANRMVCDYGFASLAMTKEK
jgi:2-polyprenyl-3-methyl-5-hydroxy-6-metoxy-1,4-benzoquinol methylase